jgi:hypothetical protein
VVQIKGEPVKTEPIPPVPIRRGTPVGLDAAALVHEIAESLGLSAVVSLMQNEVGCTTWTVAEKLPLGETESLTLQFGLLASHLPRKPGILAICDVFSHPLIRPSEIPEGHRLRSALGMEVTGAESSIREALFFIDHEHRRWSDDDASGLRKLADCFGVFSLEPEITPVNVGSHAP